jgi:hypothetical protein
MQQLPCCPSGAAKVSVLPQASDFCVWLFASIINHFFSSYVSIGTVHTWHLDVNVTSQRESLSKNASVLLDKSRSSAKIRVGAAVIGVCAVVVPDGQTGSAIAVVNEKGRLEVTHVCGGNTNPVISR